MRIEKGKYVLYSDEWNLWINEIRTYEKGKRIGETFEVRIAGYCTSIDKLISDFSERVLRSSDAEDLESVLTALQTAQDACKAMLTEAVKEGAINVDRQV
jgi:hypothetical protein